MSKYWPETSKGATHRHWLIGSIAVSSPPQQAAIQIDYNSPYALAVPHYDKLRLEAIALPRLLVLLRLPRNPDEWLDATEDALIARRCAYWLSLRGACPSANEETQTVYVPRGNLLPPAALTSLMARFSRLEEVSYVA